ncbi:hypothetical protein [Variovorax terrae]|uniref:Uncharacterized protein n=1 Tax=Variovorax terrae TaxID=2923278 RepID=A0A9X2ANV0_9BURK|nr:hypothetical protein [Variovorax terrae]MCJ0764165.1 hypothetical protein [Variovorax terrae]
MEKVLIWDMMRARQGGKTVPRWQAGRLRAVRGILRIGTLNSMSLCRPSLTARFECTPPLTEHDDPAPLEDAHVIFCDENRMVITGVEVVEGFAENDELRYGHTWVLHLYDGPEPVGTRGPPLPQ